MRVDAFVRNLARPPVLPRDAVAQAGALRFAKLGCTGCHVPEIGVVVGAYSDLLLHDLGPALDSGIKDGVASGRQWRTAPLWGFRYRQRYLHDDRAADLTTVLAHHGGEASRPSRRFLALPDAGKAEILAFLRTL